MLVVRCGVVFLALLACAHAESCVKKTYGSQKGYPIPVQPYSTYDDRTSLKLPFSYNLCGCRRVVGSWVKVCVERDAWEPDVDLNEIDVVNIVRNGPDGEMTVYSGGFCRHRPYNRGQGAALPSPTVEKPKRNY